MKSYFVLNLIISLTAMSTTAALAQTAVIDNANLQQNTQTAAQAAAAVQQLQASLTQLQQTYAMFTTIPNTTAMAPGLDNPTLENPMPSVASVVSLINGQDSSSGIAVISNAKAINNIDTLATTNLAAVEQRLAQLPLLEADIAAATSITQLVAINDKITLQSQFVAAQQVQAGNLQVLAFEQAQANSAQIQDEHDREASALAAQYKAAAEK